MSPNPFQADIFPDGLPLHETAAVLHPGALDDLQALLHQISLRPLHDAPLEGTVCLLKAPRAGYGKSHLLALLAQRLGDQAQILAPQLAPDGRLTWAALYQNTLAQWHRQRTSNGRMTKLDELTRQLFGLINAELIRESRVPCANPAAAIQALRQRPTELFDLQDARQAVGRWFMDHFERLLPVTSAALANFTGCSQEACVTWLRGLCAYAQGANDGEVLRFEQLSWNLQQGNSQGLVAGGMQILTAPALNESFYQARLTELLRLASQVTPLVLVFDHLDGVHGEGAATMQVARTLAEFRSALPRALIILSVNQDLWSGSFQKFLPSALEDRLTSERIVLRDLTAEQGLRLLEHRLQQAGIAHGEGAAFLTAVQLPQWFAREPSRLASARSLLRHAARAWEEWRGRAQPSAVEVSSELPDPVETLPSLPAGLPLTNGTSFQQLKLMLEKLRLERIANGKAPMQISESGAIYHEPEPPAGVTTLATDPLSIEAEFFQLRQRLLGATPLRIDPDLFGHLLDTGGKRLAVVSPSHIPVPGSAGPGALLWHTPNGEILFGSEPAQDHAYWQALLAHVRTRQENGHSHLAIFSSSQEPTDLQPWLTSEELHAPTPPPFLDIVSLDAPTLATLYAADELLHASEHAPQPTHPLDEVFTTMAPHLDSFWKRLLRPLPQGN